MKKKIYNFIMCTLISLYFALAITWDYTGTLARLEFVKKYVLVFAIVELVVLFAWNKFSFILFQKKLKKTKFTEFIVYFLIVTIPIVYTIYAYYPTVGSEDTIGVWNEVHNVGMISNWFPIIYQFFFIYLPMKIWNNIYSTMIAQVLIIIVVTLYMCSFFRKNYLSFKQTAILLLLIVLNPIFLKYSVYSSKDVIYAYFVLLLTLNLIEIVNSSGKWLNGTKNKILFIISSIGVLTIRHNGIISFVGTLFFAFLLVPKVRKFIFISTSLILISFFVLTGPIYNKLDFGKTGGRIEMVGVILNNLSYYYNNNIMTKEESNVILKLQPSYVWSESYRLNSRNFNIIKNYTPSDIECEQSPKYCDDDLGMGFGNRLEENFKDTLRTWFDISKKHPILFLKSYLNVTSPIWEIKKEISGFYVHFVNEEQIDGKNLKLHEIFQSYYKFVYSTPLRVIGIGFGEGLFIIIISIFIIIKKTKFKLEKLLPFVPVLSNTAGVMMLITGEEYRFVYSQVICSIPLALYTFQNYTKKEL